jgi:transposase InsO family protein
MSTEEKMTIEERYKYLRLMKKRYVKAGRKEKGQFLDEMEEVTGLHRKSLIRLLKSNLRRKNRSKERGATYGADIDDALRVIDESFDFICAERLTPNLVWMARHLEKHGELRTTPQLIEQLREISVSTVRRRQARIRKYLPIPRLPRKKPSGSKFIQDIPMLRLPWDTSEPGHFETDLVHHCGRSASGQYVCTLQMIDIFTGWSERAAVLGRGSVVMEDAFRRILIRLPFPILEIHPDNGSEFFNHHMLRFWGEIVQGVTISRSRPYHKNDNPHVEQKNSTLVRNYLGHDRIDSVAQVIATNELYDKMWLYYNFFQPVMHLKEKKIISEEGQTRVKRLYDKAQTPFDRLCKTDAILPEHRQQLEALRDQTNPRSLHQAIYDDIDRIFELPGAATGETENIYLTLMDQLEPREGKLNLLDLAFNRTSIKDDEQSEFRMP